jgi:hypothetical protein
LVNREADAHVCRLRDTMGREPGLPGARDIGGIVIEVQDLVGHEAEMGGQTAERLRVRLAPAELGGKDRARAEDVRDSGKHLSNVPLQQQRIVGEHPNRMVRAELSREREYGEVWLDRRPPGFDPLRGAERVAHPLAKLSQVLVRRHDTPFCLVFEPREPDGGVDRVRALPAPRSE